MYTLQGTNILLMGEILQHLIFVISCTLWSILHINWCRISSINSIPSQFRIFASMIPSQLHVWWDMISYISSLEGIHTYKP